MGDRAATLLFFLSTPDAGGATVFPLLGISVAKLDLLYHTCRWTLGATCGRRCTPLAQPWPGRLGSLCLLALRLPCTQRRQKGKIKIRLQLIVNRRHGMHLQNKIPMKLEGCIQLYIVYSGVERYLFFRWPTFGSGTLARNPVCLAPLNIAN